jgi:hypothetical protein
MIRLEKWSGKKSRHTCPSCNSKNEFTRFIDDDGKYLPDNVGICNRASKCGYRYTAKQFFSDNPESKVGLKFSKGKRKRISNYGFAAKSVSQATQTPQTALDIIPFEHLIATLGNYENNSFVQFLIDLFPDCIEEIKEVVKQYFIGTTKLGKTVFWQVDQKKRIRTGKIIAYDITSGKRRKDVKPNWIHSELKRLGRLGKDFNLMQCFFGQHLLLENSDKPIAITEAEKSAIVGRLCFPEWLWLAVGSKQNLTIERLQRLGTRQMILFPDADGYSAWQQIGIQAKRQGLNISVSDWIETNATIEQKAEGFDIADYLIEQQRGINEYNEYIDADNLGVYEPDEQDSLDARLEREAVLEYENMVSA